MVLTYFDGAGIGFGMPINKSQNCLAYGYSFYKVEFLVIPFSGFGVGCGFGVGWGFGGLLLPPHFIILLIYSF